MNNKKSQNGHHDMMLTFQKKCGCAGEGFENSETCGQGGGVDIRLGRDVVPKPA